MEETVENIETVNEIVEPISTNQEIAESLVDKIPFIPFDKVLVKPLPVYNYKAKKFVPKTHGIDKKTSATKADFEEREIPVTSGYRLGVILRLPEQLGVLTHANLVVGDTIVYRTSNALEFDYFKDSQLVTQFDVAGKWVGDTQFLYNDNNIKEV